MAYIAPNSNIYLMRGVRLDPTYENTIFFDTSTAQSAYFQSKTVRTLAAQSYQRKNKNTLRIQVPYSQVFDVNYMAFLNLSFESKMFYAFVKKVEYINNVTTEIEYELDVMQTWMFNYTLGQCFVEREHAARDYIGDNVLPEPISVTEWAYTEKVQCPAFDPTPPAGASDYLDYLPKVLVFSSEGAYSLLPQSWAANWADEPFVFTGSKVYNAGYINGFLPPASGVSPNPNIAAFLEQVVKNNKAGSIICLVMCPGLFAPYLVFNSTAGKYVNKTSHINNPYSWNIPKNLSWTYKKNGVNVTPRNMKLYTFQFNKLIITDHNEASAEFAYEYFVGSQTDCQFNVFACITPNPEFSCVPLNYKGMPVASIYQLVSHGYPQCSWKTDAYDAWLAQNKYRILTGSATGMAGAATGAAIGGATGNAVGAVGSAISPLGKAMSNLGEALTQQTLPDQMRGSIGQSINMQSESEGFCYYTARAIDQVCAMADDFFDMYGYKTCLNKIPNRKVRENWTYTKTVGCAIFPNNTTDVPAEDSKKIQSIYDAGIRFWVNGDNIGNYYLSNLCL